MCVAQSTLCILIYPNLCAENWDLVRYPFTRGTNTVCLQDIHDTKKYKRLSRPGKFLSFPEHTGLILSTDGVPLFKSSGRLLIDILRQVALHHAFLIGQSIWPVQLCITSLPPDIRMNVKYLLLAAVWLGPVKPPDFSII